MAPEYDSGANFEKLLNFRDVGDYLSRYNNYPVLKPCLLYRSARLDETTSSDRDKLVNHFKIKTVIDLRSKTEHINAAKKHSDAAAIAQSAAIPATNDKIATPLELPGMRYADINLNGKGFERALIWKLKYSSLARLISLMATGYRTEGIAVLGREIMQPRGLVGLGIDTVDHSGPEIKQIFDILAEKSAYPVLIHCTQGKDRTGITVLLVLLMCRMEMRGIIQDYRRSEPELEAEKEERMKEITSIGLDETFAQCPPDFCECIRDHLVAKYGSATKYLESIGVSNSQQRSIQQILMDPWRGW